MPRWPERWIVVENWDKFQSRRERPGAPWIKNYVALLHKPEYLDLGEVDRALLHFIWLAYADQDGQLSVTDLTRWTHLRNVRRSSGVHRVFVTRSLARLNRAGFVGFCVDKPLPLTSLKPLDARDEPQPMNGRTSPVPPCRFCEVGGGLHAIDCPTLQRTTS